MSLPLIIRPEASRDIEETHGWYESQREGLGDEFLEMLDEAFQRIQRSPSLYAALPPGVRRVKLARFPYVIYYRADADRIEVFGVLHGSRNPQIWRSRS